MCKASWTVSTTNEFQLKPSNLRYYIQMFPQMNNNDSQVATDTLVIKISWTHTIHPKFIINNKTTRANLSLKLAIVV